VPSPRFSESFLRSQWQTGWHARRDRMRTWSLWVRMGKEARRGGVVGCAPALRGSAHGPHVEHLHTETPNTRHQSRAHWTVTGQALCAAHRDASQGPWMSCLSPSGFAGVGAHVLDAFQGQAPRPGACLQGSLAKLRVPKKPHASPVTNANHS